MAMRRRYFIQGIAVFSAWPRAARAQQPSMPVVGVLSPEWPNAVTADHLRAFREGLNDTGYVEGRNVIIEYRWAEGRYERLPALAAELVRLPVNVIVCFGSTLATIAAKTASATIPIVFYGGTDPVSMGLVASLSRPGGNVTGVTTLNIELMAKRLELLHELVPAATIIAALVNPTNTVVAETETRDLQAAARTLGLTLHVLHASSEQEIDTAFMTLVQLRAGALVIGNDAYFNSRSEQLAVLTLRYAMPAIYNFREFVLSGGLASFGATVADTYRPLGVYTGRILKGEKPGDLPVQQATKLQLVINMKTAKALGIAVPLPLSGRADELIE
jgi:putative tryptophan/tyrosine transport system substrate-binding protein